MNSCRTHLKFGDILLKRFQIKAFLGSGGMSSVYLAEELCGPRKYFAVKESMLAPKFAHQLLAEAKMLKDLDHPHLPRVAELCLSGDRNFFYIIQDYIEGVTLARLFQHHQRKLSSLVILNFLIQICEILEYLHLQRIVYKDLKPGNLMIDLKGQVKMIDFGIAQKYGETKDSAALRIGTVGFAAPEQYTGKKTDARTDLYALGMLMFYLFSGGKHFQRNQENLRKIRPKLPGKLHLCIEKLTRIEPDERVQSAEEVRFLLVNALGKMKKKEKRKFLFSKRRENPF